MRGADRVERQPSEAPSTSTSGSSPSVTVARPPTWARAPWAADVHVSARQRREQQLGSGRQRGHPLVVDGVRWVGVGRDRPVHVRHHRGVRLQHELQRGAHEHERPPSRHSPQATSTRASSCRTAIRPRSRPARGRRCRMRSTRAPRS
jgi:hypothetical protein